MRSTTETGHAKNLANLQDLTEIIVSYGNSYNPTKAKLKLAALITLQDQAKANMAVVSNKSVAYNNATNERETLFEPLRKLSTRLVSALTSTEATPQTIKDAKTIHRKIQGTRATPKPKQVDPNTPAPATISVAQLSFDQQIEHLNTFIEILKAEPSYAPNETDLKITTLYTLHTNLTVANTNVSTNFAAIANARIARNKTFYHPQSGLVAIALAVKEYIKSVYGFASPEYKLIRKIQFKIVE